MNKKRLDKLLKVCYNRTIKNVDNIIPTQYYVVAALLDKRGKEVLRVGNNKYKTHTEAKNYGYKYPYLHAELDVCIRYGLHRCDDLNLLVFRITPKEHRITMAKPCCECERALTKIGINTVYYTDWEGELCELYLT